MDRRQLLKTLATTAAGIGLAETFDWDRLLWVPGAKKIFIPAPDMDPLVYAVAWGGWNRNFFLSAQTLVRESEALEMAREYDADRLTTFTPDGKVVKITSLKPSSAVFTLPPPSCAGDFSRSPLLSIHR